MRPLSTALIVLWSSLVALADTEPVSIGSRRELFVDHFLIESMTNTELRLQRPHREDIAVRFDRPWEGPFSAYPTVIKDGDLYRMYYRGMPGPEVENRRAVTCYAESHDGIHWKKPDLGLFEYAGSTANNIVLMIEEAFSGNFSPFLDTCPFAKSEERYKAVAGNESTGLHGFVSPDGLHWTPIRDGPIFRDGMFDSQNVAFWSEAENQYVCYFRTWTGKGYTGFRTISRTTSPDFNHWTEPLAMTFGDTPAEHLYTNGTQPYFRAPHIYISLAKRFFPDSPGYTGADASDLVAYPEYRVSSSDSILMSTRGGNHYDRTFMEAFIRPGDTHRDWIARDNTPAVGIVPGNDRQVFIYRMSHYAQPTAHLGRYSLRTDGFISVHFPYEGGSLTTRKIVFSGNALEINYETSAAGGLRIEILDESEAPMPGFSMDDCEILRGNEIAQIVQWKSPGKLAKLAGKAVRLRFVGRDADLYSFRFLE